MDAEFDYEAFYWNIVGLFDDGELSNVLETYNKSVTFPIGDTD